jgi:phosphatidate cytidylyltransferase
MSLLQNPNFRTRTATGALFVAVIAACIFIHAYSFFALVLAINFLCLNEFYKLTLEPKQTVFRATALVAGLLPVVLYILSYADLDISGTLLRIITPAFFVLTFLLLFLQLPYRSVKPFTNLGFAYLGWFYISVPVLLLLLNTAKFFEGYNPKFAMLLFILVWVNDTGAYLAGSTMGRTKFFERISPKKTWEGTIGGVILCIIVSALYGKLVLHSNVIQYAGLGMVIGIFSTLGDLIESQLKRSLDIKDSGTLLPGHGGALDRFDGFLTAMPAALFYFALLKGF